MRNTITVLAILLATMTTAAQATPTAVVTRIIDGDTIETSTGRVRIACVDAPESSQGGAGNTSTAELRRLLPIGTQVTLKGAQRDRYGRQISEVWRGNTNIGLAQVASGQAFVYRQYLRKPCLPFDYEAAEKRARANQLGIWGYTNLVKPWDYRRGYR